MKKQCKNCGQRTEEIETNGQCVGCNIADKEISNLIFYPEEDEPICYRCGEYFSDCDCP